MNHPFTATPPTRPRLAHLRSTWISEQLSDEYACMEDKLIDISLPSIQDEATHVTYITKEVYFLITMATTFCLITALISLLNTDLTLLNTLFMAASLSLFAWNMMSRQMPLDTLLLQIRINSIGIIILLPLYYIILYYNHSMNMDTHNKHSSNDMNTEHYSNNNRHNGSNNSHDSSSHYNLYSDYYYLHLMGVVFALLMYYIAYRLISIYKIAHRIIINHYNTHIQQSRSALEQAKTDYSLKRSSFMSTVSHEIHDASLMIIATLEQFSPSSILSQSHELLSACSMAVPIASISAINTTINQVCYISSHLNLMSRMLLDDTRTIDPDDMQLRSVIKNNFDVCQLVQNLGDSLAGISAKLGVHFVIYHMDNGLHYSNVKGDENAIKHALMNLLRNMLEGCTPGACIELGLHVAQIPDSPKVKVIFDILQLVSPAIPDGISAASIPNANLTAQLLKYVDGHMELEDVSKNKTRIKLSLELLLGSENDQRLLMIEKPSQILEKHLSNIQFSSEPTLEELSKFIVKLKGVKMILHAPEKSVFAKHLTSCLTSWNTDISHVPVLGCMDLDDEGSSCADTATVSTSDSDTSTRSQPINPTTEVNPFLTASHRSYSSNMSSNKIPSSATEEDNIHAIPPAFILIDDDLLTLEQKLMSLRDQLPAPSAILHQHQQRRHRRSKSRSGFNESFMHGTVAIIFFASLANFKKVRDTSQWFSNLQQSRYMPRVVVVPKPAGPRRFLTALHTAWINAIVEPQFLPIATSPLSPFTTKSGGTNTPSSQLSAQQEVLDSPLNTPGGILPPHDVNRFSPGRRMNAITNTASRTNLHSPSSLQLDGEKGNYFFDPNHTLPNHLSGHTLTHPTPNKIPTPTAISTNNSPNLNSSNMASSTINSINALNAENGIANASTLMKRRTPASSDPSDNPSVVPPVENEVVDPSTKASHKPHFMEGTNVSESIDKKNDDVPKSKSKFSFKIRNRKRKERSQSDKQSPPITVLIVEDNMVNQAILSTWMKKHNINFSVASDGKEAVEKWKKGEFHLILMDIQLPVMNGLEATKRIRAIEKENKIGVLPSIHYVEEVPIDPLNMKMTVSPTMSPSISSPTNNIISFQSPVIIVALTASSLESDRRAALAAGCNDFLTKPVSLEWLEKKIMEWGCMQALIDFEGWKKWRRSTDHGNNKTYAIPSDPNPINVLSNMTTEQNEMMVINHQRERDLLIERTKNRLKDESKHIILMGNSKRRPSVMPEENYSIRNVDSDMYPGELSIPRQVGMRERRMADDEDDDDDDDEYDVQQ
ncbi:hypothetical protein BDB01DRAFT_782034 [Pilobolus umbonatus]|nr:hypothetical protein BDB01DRAFT_782034 [Pilobolus umbonatus]